MSTPNVEHVPMPEVVPVFVYGSLLPGLHNHRMAVPAMAHEPIPAVIHGFELYSNSSDSYPYLMVGEGDVKGAILFLRQGAHLMNIVGMEEGAGYDTRLIKADIEVGGVKQEVEVVAFILPEYRRHFVGRKVEDGDWARYFAQHGMRFGGRFGN